MLKQFFFTLMVASTVASLARASDRCKRSLDYKDPKGEITKVYVETDCPEAKIPFMDLQCEGNVFGGTIRATCTNHKNGESSSNQSSPSAPFDSTPTSSSAECGLH
jgi:hypothetical protein